MLGKKELLKIRSHLEKAQSPLFYFDNDQDGICSYLIFRRNIRRGKGVPVKSSPLGEEYFRRVTEFNPDYVFILDQPNVEKEFFDKIKERNIPVIWIDHHDVDFNEIPSWVEYFNPIKSKKEAVPTTKICYEVFSKNSDLWLLIAGCIADHFIPKEYSKFMKNYPELSKKSDDPFEIYYSTGIGKISRIIGAGLKDRTTNVMKMIRFLLEVKSPNEILNDESNSFYSRFIDLDSKLKILILKAEKKISQKSIFFEYRGETSMSADIANKLNYLYPEKIIIVAYVKGNRVNLSIRGKNVKKKIEPLLDNLSSATGGGHDDAVGAQMTTDDLKKFKEEFKKVI